MGVFGRLFRDNSGGPADQIIRWLSDKSIDDRRLAGGLLFGGPHSQKVEKWILSRPDCDLGTASRMLWDSGRPDLIMKDAETAFPMERVLMRELIRFIVDRWRQGLFVDAEFEFDNREHTKRYRRELKKKGLQGHDPFEIPEAAWQPIKGRKIAPSEATGVGNANFNAMLDALRLADLAELNPSVWEPLRKRSLGLE